VVKKVKVGEFHEVDFCSKVSAAPDNTL